MFTVGSREEAPKDANGAYFVDRNPRCFEAILDWLREYGRRRAESFDGSFSVLGMPWRMLRNARTSDVPGSDRGYDTELFHEAIFYGLAPLMYGRIYVAGGFNHDGTGMLDTAEQFDPATRSWLEAPAMPCAQTTSACATMGHLMFLAGGTADSKTLCFNGETHLWSTLPAMETKRQGHGLVAINSCAWL